MYDICIIGGGPAGATLARLVGSRFRVLVADKAAGKVCGGLLSPRAQAELVSQRLGVPSMVTDGPQLFGVRTRDLGSGVEQVYQRHYLNVDRTRFDAWLLGLVGDDVEVVSGWRALRIEPERGYSIVHFATPDGGHASVGARLVVGADGASSMVRRHLMGGVEPRGYVAVQGVFGAHGDESTYGAFFDPGLTDFYGWTIPKAQGVVAGIALPAGCAPLERYAAFIAALRDCGAIAGEEIDRGAAPVLRPAPSDAVAVAGQGSLLLGEAAGLISPSSAEGISYALRSGALAARALSDGIEDAPRRYRRLVAPLVFGCKMKSAKSAAISSPRIRAAVMSTGVGALSMGAPARVVEPVGAV